MSMRRIDRDEFVMFRYIQDADTDHTHLKKALMEDALAPKDKDTVLEFATATAIYSMEIGIIVQYLKTFADTNRKLRFVGSVYVCEMLTTMNIHKIPNIVLYDNLHALHKVYPTVDFSEFEC